MSTTPHRYYDRTPREVAAYFGVDAEGGLSTAEARERARADGANRLYVIKKYKMRDLLFSSLLGLSPLGLLAAVVAAIAARDGLWIAILIFWTAITAVGAAIYLYFAKKLTALMNARLPLVSVMRDGREARLSYRRVVRGDVIILREGDIVPAHCRLYSSRELVVIENANGTTYERIKNAEFIARPDPNSAPLADAPCMVLPGAVIVSGNGRAIVCEYAEPTQVINAAAVVASTANCEVFGAKFARFQKYISLSALGVFFVFGLLSIVVYREGLGGNTLFFCGALLFGGLPTAAMTPFYALIIGRAATRSGAYSLRDMSKINLAARADVVLLPTSLLHGEGEEKTLRSLRTLREYGVKVIYFADENFPEPPQIASAENNIVVGLSDLIGRTDAQIIDYIKSGANVFAELDMPRRRKIAELARTAYPEATLCAIVRGGDFETLRLLSIADIGVCTIESSSPAALYAADISVKSERAVVALESTVTSAKSTFATLGAIVKYSVFSLALRTLLVFFGLFFSSWSVPPFGILLLCLPLDTAIIILMTLGGRRGVVAHKVWRMLISPFVGAALSAAAAIIWLILMPVMGSPIGEWGGVYMILCMTLAALVGALMCVRFKPPSLKTERYAAITCLGLLAAIALTFAVTAIIAVTTAAFGSQLPPPSLVGIALSGILSGIIYKL